MVETDKEEKERTIKDMVVFLMGRGDTKNPENTEFLYASVRSWGAEEEDNTTFID